MGGLAKAEGQGLAEEGRLLWAMQKSCVTTVTIKSVTHVGRRAGWDLSETAGFVYAWGSAMCIYSRDGVCVRVCVHFLIKLITNKINTLLDWF